MNRLVRIYERNGRLFITACHKTEAGFWIGDDDLLTADRHDLEGVVDAFSAALSKSRVGVATPPPTASFTAPLVKAAGVRSWTAFSKVAKSVAVELMSDTIEITPDRNLGGRKGFVPLVEKSVRLHQGDPQLGTAILAALDVAE